MADSETALQKSLRFPTPFISTIESMVLVNAFNEDGTLRALIWSSILWLCGTILLFSGTIADDRRFTSIAMFFEPGDPGNEQNCMIVRAVGFGLCCFAAILGIYSMFKSVMYWNERRKARNIAIYDAIAKEKNTFLATGYSLGLLKTVANDSTAAHSKLTQAHADALKAATEKAAAAPGAAAPDAPGAPGAPAAQAAQAVAAPGAAAQAASPASA